MAENEVVGSVRSTLGVPQGTPPAKRRELPQDRRVASAAAPGTVSFEGVRSFEVDGVARRAYGLRDFSTVNLAGWASLFDSSPGSRCTISVKPSDGEAIRKAINHADARAGVNLVSGGSATKMMDNQLDRDHARTALEMMADQKKTFLNASFIYQIEADDESALSASYRRVRDSARPKGFTVDPCARAQEAAFRDGDPLACDTDPYLGPRFCIDMPSDTLAASQPFSVGGIVDACGTVLGCDAAGAMVRADMLAPSPSRPNFNVFMNGASGKGKSRTLKKILMDEYARGARVIWIDPEQEGKHLCKRLYGQYINAGGGSKVMLCPLQPRALNFEYSDDAGAGEEAAVGVLRSTVSFVRGFYQLAFGVADEFLPHLDKALVEAYAAHGLTYETPFEQIDFDDYPSMDELAAVLARRAKEEERPRVAEALDSMAEQTATGGVGGLYGDLWSGQTNISLYSDFIVFDIGALMSGNVSAAARDAQMYSVLTFIWSEVCRSRVSGKPLRLVIDEGHMLFGTGDGSARRTSPVAAALTATIVRRARKYNCGVLFATQRLKDMTDAAVSQHGEVILDCSTYQFCFGTDDLAPVMELMHVPAGQAARIPHYDRGRCVFRAGKAMCELQVEDTEAERPWIGKAGGR